MLLVACAPPPARVAPAAPDTLHARVEVALERAVRGRSLLERSVHEPEALARLYGSRRHRAAWLEPSGDPRREARALMSALWGSVRHGLRPEHYHAYALSGSGTGGGLLGGRGEDLEHLAALDVLASDAYLHLARDLASGAVDPSTLHPGFSASGPPADLPRALDRALETGDVGGTLARLAPPHPEYAALVRALGRLRGAITSSDATAFAQAARVRANLERWRWLPRDLGRRHLRVNTPTYTLRAYEEGEPVLSMRVVVGSQDWQTPLARGLVTSLVLSPPWDVPTSIATTEMLPEMQRDPEYFDRTGMELREVEGGVVRRVDPAGVDWSRVTPEEFPFYLRQPPGPSNPMGRIKLVFDNPHGVFLHGTPARAAFERDVRTLSHGCIRVEDEVALAAFALGSDPLASEGRLAEALAEAEAEGSRRVTLPDPLPVHLLYFTAEVDARGRLSFADDPYRWDLPLVDALDAPHLDRRPAAEVDGRIGGCAPGRSTPPALPTRP